MLWITDTYINETDNGISDWYEQNSHVYINKFAEITDTYINETDNGISDWYEQNSHVYINKFADHRLMIK